MSSPPHMFFNARNVGRSFDDDDVSVKSSTSHASLSRPVLSSASTYSVPLPPLKTEPRSPRRRFAGPPQVYDSVVLWGNLSVVLFSNLLGVVFGYLMQSYVVFNICSIPLCFNMVALPTLASPRTKAHKKISAIALLMYAGRSVLDTVLARAAHDIEHTTHSSETLPWISLRMLILYGAVATMWTILSLMPHFIGSSMSNAAMSTGFTYSGFTLALLGLIMQSLPDDATADFLLSQKSWLPEVLTSVELVDCFRLHVIGGEVLFWFGVTAMNAPALMRQTRNTRYLYQPAQQETPQKSKSLGSFSTVCFVLFCLFSLWAILTPTPAGDTPGGMAEAGNNSSTFLDSVVPNEWRVIRTLLLTRHGFLQHFPHYHHPHHDHAAIRGHLGLRHHRPIHLRTREEFASSLAPNSEEKEARPPFLSRFQMKIGKKAQKDCDVSVSDSTLDHVFGNSSIGNNGTHCFKQNAATQPVKPLLPPLKTGKAGKGRMRIDLDDVFDYSF